ncbi:hypothetical protein AB0958_18850 [Streptomyces sp. NPDC006655]|uniref:hypothetical protein n=1 Tax=Streptomyces sp. NPDC006655 TaxID=3156898 RepID=UPI003453F91A
MDMTQQKAVEDAAREVPAHDGPDRLTDPSIPVEAMGRSLDAGATQTTSVPRWRASGAGHDGADRDPGGRQLAFGVWCVRWWSELARLPPHAGAGLGER